MPKRIRPIRPQLEPFSHVALKVLHVLEPVVGRIIGTAVIKFACEKAMIDPEQLQPAQVGLLIAHIKTSLAFYDRSEEVEGALQQLATDQGRGET